MTEKRIGVIGSGDVGKALTAGLAKHGYDVVIGTRDAAKLEAWRKGLTGTVRVGSFSDAARHGPIVILATHGAGTEEALRIAGPAHFAGKVVLDATNPLDFSAGMPPTLFVGTTDSLGERVQRALPEARVVKCFNTVANAKMVDPTWSEGAPRMMICGNDAAAKREAEALLKELGWPGALDLGNIQGARWLEAIVPLWVRAGAVLGTYGHAFKVVT